MSQRQRRSLLAILVAVLSFAWSPEAQIRIRRIRTAETSPNATPNFVPTGNGASNTWTANGAASAWDSVNDTVGTPDDDTTYASKTTDDGDQLFTFDTPTASGTINSVSVTTRWRAGPSTFGVVRRILRVGGVNYSSATVLVSSQTYANGTTTWVTNPKTGVAWTADDVNGVGANALQQFGVGVTTLGGVESIRLTSTHLTIDYVAGGGGGEGTPAAPSGFSPADNAVDQPVDVTLACDQQADATSYRIFYGTTSGSLSELTLPDPTICNVQVSGIANDDEVFWKVVPVNGFGQNETSAELSFTVASAGGGEMDLVAASSNCADSNDNSPTGRNPRLLWTCARQEAWNQMVADYQAAGCSALASAGTCSGTPATRGGRWFKQTRAIALTTSGVTYSDSGQYNALMYQMTGDPVYITHASFGAYKKIHDGFISNGVPTNVDVPRITQGLFTLMLEWAWPALTDPQRIAWVDELDEQNDDSWWRYGFGAGRWTDPDQTIGQWYFPVAMMKIILPNNVSNNAIWDDPNMGGFDVTSCTFEGAQIRLRDGICVMTQVIGAGGEYLEGPMYAKETVPYLAALAQAVSDARGVDTYPEVTAFLEEYATQQLATYTPDLLKQVQYADEQNPFQLQSFYVGDTLRLVSGLLQGTDEGDKAHQLLADMIAVHGESTLGPEAVKWWGTFVYNPYADVADWKTAKTHFASGMGSQYLRSGFTATDSLFHNICNPRHFRTASNVPYGYDHQIYYLCGSKLYFNGEWIIDNIGSYAGASNFGEGNSVMRYNGFADATEYKQIRQHSLADTHAFMAATTGGTKRSFSLSFQPPPTMLNEGSRATLHVPGAVSTIIIHDRASVDEIAAGSTDFDRYNPGCTQIDGKNWITQQHARQEWLWHIPVAPTVSSGVYTWDTLNGQKVKLTPLLPLVANRVETVYDLATSFAQSLLSGARCGWVWDQILPPGAATAGYPYYEADGAGYDRKLLKIWPSTMGTFHTYLAVLQVGSSTPTTPTVITNNNAECAHVVTSGQNDILACFNAATSTVLDNTFYNPAHKTILDSARLRTSGSFTIPVTTVAGTLEVHLADLPPSLTCTYNMDAAGAVSIPSGGAGGLTETGGYARIPLTLSPGVHSLVVSCS